MEALCAAVCTGCTFCRPGFQCTIRHWPLVVELPPEAFQQSYVQMCGKCVCVFACRQKVIIGLDVKPHCEPNDSPDSRSFSPNITTQMRRRRSAHTFACCVRVHELKHTGERQRMRTLMKRPTLCVPRRS